MLLELYKLYKRNGASKTPLEDFTTEALAGLLRLNPNFLEAFLKLIKLPKDNYKVITQKHYLLHHTSNCIVDLVFIGKENICFIENKVHSYEGWEQLARYGLALTKYYPNHQTHLRYCTKYLDVKNITEHEFYQYTWRDVGKLIFNNSNKNLIDFHNYLNYHNMGGNYNIDLNTLVTMKNLGDTLSMAKFHVENCRQEFQSIFANAAFESQTKLNSIYDDDRFGFRFINIFDGANAWTELLYSINFWDMQVSTQIFVHKEDLNHNLIINRLRKFEVLSLIEHETGTSLILIKKLADLIDDEEADLTIKNWFHSSFLTFADIIRETPELNWKIKVNNLSVA